MDHHHPAAPESSAAVAAAAAAAASFFFDGDSSAVADPPWDPDSAAALFPLEPFFGLDESDLRPHTNTPTAAPPTPSPSDLAIGLSTCGSQAARAASRSRAGIDTLSTSSPFPDADPTWPPHPVAAHTASPVPSAPAVLNNIARVYAANAARRSPAPSPRPSSSKQLASGGDGTYLAGHAGPPAWASLPVNQPPSAPRPARRTLQAPTNTTSLLTAARPYPTFSPALPVLPQWAADDSTVANSNPSGDALFSLLPRDFDDILGLVKTQSGAAATTPTWLAPPYYANPPNAQRVPHTPTPDHGPRPSAPAAKAIATPTANPAAPPPGPQRPPKKGPKPASSMTLAIVQYKPSSDAEASSSRKRPALEEVVPQGMTSRTLREVLVQDDSGQVKGTMMTFGNRAKTRAVFTEEKRQRTALARREGVCPRCKKSKRQCDLAQQHSPYVSCTLCVGTKIYKNAPRHPCFKATLEEILFFRSGPAKNEPFFTQRRSVYDLGDVSKPEVPVRTLRLTQHIGPHQLTVYASEFLPMDGDVVSYKWTDDAGTPCELKMPHFCLTNIEKIRAHLQQYIASAKWSYLRSLEQEDRLAWMTISAATDYAKANPESLVADAVTLWAVSRIIEIPWEMTGADTLGISKITNPTSPHNGKIPIPPIMDTQLDQVVIQNILTPLRKRVVDKFEKLITPVKREAWWEVYLSAFVILNHIERLARHSANHARTHTLPSKYSNIPFLEAVFHTAKSILARFHFVCNGAAPLRLDWSSPKAAALAKLEPHQVRFMQETQAIVAQREKDVLSLRTSHQYERPLYWAGQLFYEDFDTSPVHVVEELDEEGR